MAVCTSTIHQTLEKVNLLSENISSLMNQARSVTDYTDESIEELDKSHQTILSEAAAHRDKIIQRVHDSFNELSMEMSDIVKERKAILAKTRAMLDQNMLSLSSMLESLQQKQYSESSERKVLLDLDKTAEKVKIVSDELKGVDMSSVTIRCDFNVNIQPLVESGNKFGEINVESTIHQFELLATAKQRPIVENGKGLHTVEDRQLEDQQIVHDDQGQLQLRKIGEINIRLADDTRDCYIRGIDITEDGNIIIADFNNSKIKLLETGGNLLSFLKLSSKPKEVTVIKDSKAVVSMLGVQMCKQIGIINIGEGGALSWNGTIKTTYAVGGITSYKDNLIITCDESSEKLRSVQMINMDGNVIWTVTKDKDGGNLFDFGRFLAVRCSKEGDSLIVTDVGKQSINIIDAISGEVVEVSKVKGREPRGVCVDDLGNVYVCYKSGEITIWSGDMTEERCLVNDPEQLECPLAMVYDNRNSELLVTSSSLTQEQFCNFIHRYQSC